MGRGGEDDRLLHRRHPPRLIQAGEDRLELSHARTRIKKP